MPILKSLANDDKFYGKIKPEGQPLTNELYKGSNKQPPNPLTPNVKYRTKEAQEIAKTKLNEALSNPEPDYPETKDPVKDQQISNISGKNDVQDYVEKEKSLGQRFSDFLTGDLTETTAEQKATQKQRVLSRIGVSPEPVDNKVSEESAEYFREKTEHGLETVGKVYKETIEAPRKFLENIGNRITNNITQIVLFGAGLYLLSSFLQNPALLDRRAPKRNYTKKTAIAEK